MALFTWDKGKICGIGVIPNGIAKLIDTSPSQPCSFLVNWTPDQLDPSQLDPWQSGPPSQLDPAPKSTGPRTQVNWTPPQLHTLSVYGAVKGQTQCALTVLDGLKTQRRCVWGGDMSQHKIRLFDLLMVCGGNSLNMVHMRQSQFVALRRICVYQYSDPLRLSEIKWNAYTHSCSKDGVSACSFVSPQKISFRVTVTSLPYDFGSVTLSANESCVWQNLSAFSGTSIRRRKENVFFCTGIDGSRMIQSCTFIYFFSSCTVFVKSTTEWTWYSRTFQNNTEQYTLCMTWINVM